MNRASIVILLALLLSAPAVGGENLEMDLFSTDPLVMDLWEDRAPASAVAVDGDHPLALTAARGEAESALLAIRAKSDLPSLSWEPDPPGRAGLRFEVRVVKSFVRATAYSRMAGDRYPGRYSREGGMPFPDILVRDEPAFDAAVAGWSGSLPDEAPGAGAVTAPVEAGGLRYLLVTAHVSPEASAGTLERTIRVEGGGVSLRVPLRLTVRRFVLERTRDRILGVSNEFANPRDPRYEASLRMLARIGMTFTRVSDFTSLPDAKERFEHLRSLGYTHVLQNRPPRRAEDLEKIPAGISVTFYGRDEPQPKDRRRADWSRMADHVRLSGRIREMGGRVGTSLPYFLALELRDPKSRIYAELAKLGLRDVHEPLDWANVGLGLQRMGGPPRPAGESNAELFAYIEKLQEEFRLEGGAKPPPGKHEWIETFYWPQGLIRYPYFARLLYGFFLFQSHLDGAMAWTLWRPRDGNPFTDRSTPSASLAYPGRTTLYPTLNLVAIREGVDDLRYAQQAARTAAGRQLLEALAPYRSVMKGGKRIDLATPRPEQALAKTRETLAHIIEAGR